jgi:hypothetical protein
MAPPTTLPASLSVRDARDRYLADNGFSTAGYTAPTFQVDVLGRTWTFKNLRVRQRAVPLHDLHHVATGYGTDLVGEAEIGAWEIGGGCTNLFLYYINAAAMVLGLFLAPVRVWRAFRAGLRQRTLYKVAAPYEEVLGLDLGALRQRLGVPPDGAADHPAGLHRRAPGPAYNES